MVNIFIDHILFPLLFMQSRILFLLVPFPFSRTTSCDFLWFCSLFILQTVAGEGAVTDTLLKDVSNNVATSVFGELSARELYNVLLGQSSLSGKKAWALCDECQKWRCVPDELVHVIEKDKW